MNANDFQQAFDALVATYSERLTGEKSPEIIEKVKIMTLYSYISKSMPPLAAHWNQAHPEAKEQLLKIFSEVKQLNEKLRNG